jgi:hypothetical protein
MRVPLNHPVCPTIARRETGRAGQGRRSMSSPLMVAKNDSARALSQHWPVRPRDRVTWQSLARPAKAAEVYWAAAVRVEDDARIRVAGSDRVGQRADVRRPTGGPHRLPEAALARGPQADFAGLTFSRAHFRVQSRRR